MATVYPVVPPKSDTELLRFYEAISRHLSYQTGGGSPSGSVTPRFLGDKYLDTTNDDWYVAYGSGNTDWKSTTD
jgi:hypothetical protein